MCIRDSPIIAYLALPWLAEHIEGLWNFSGITVDQIMSVDIKPSNTTICSSLKELINSFCHCSLGSCQKVFARYFLNNGQCTIASHFLCEAISIVSSLVQHKLLSCSSSSLTTNAELIPDKLAAPILSSVDHLLEIVWKITLLTSMEENRENSALSRVKLATCMLRYSHFVKNDSYSFVKQILAILKDVKYEELSATEDKETVDDLGNALELYTEAWIGGTKNELARIVGLIKTTNTKIYELLKDHIAKKTSKGRGRLDIKSDITFNKVANTVQQTLSSGKAISSAVTASIDSQDRERINLRKVLDKIGDFTGIPSQMVIDRSKGTWTLKRHHIFSRENDSFAGSIKNSQVLHKMLLKTTPPKINYLAEDTMRYTKLLPIYEIHKGNNPNKLKTSDLAIVRHAPKIITKASTTTPELTMLYEKAVNKLILLMHSSISSNFRRVAQADTVEALKRSGQPLVPTRPRIAKHRKSYSFTTPEQSEIKPFSFYYIKRDQIAELKVADKKKVCKTNTEVNMKLSENVTWRVTVDSGRNS
eukprot:TRINITY_DN7472_c0_g2_i9.p1 TRINITY_DN7472_c0_g2~~TRINITY_DN7472_c0_g2_i9.p1  ORF type:complete len:534 (+),score=102.75 TRINITY_DN7472_c0_g2_i9:73-1674(+)